MGWSMGWNPDGHRTIRRVEEDEFQIISGPDAPPFIYAPPDSCEVVLYLADGFIPDTLYIHANQVHITEWESIWSSAFRLNPVPPDEEAKALKEAQEFYKEVTHELASDSLGYRGNGWADRFIELPNGMKFTDQTLLENAVLRDDIEQVVRYFANE